MSTNDNTSTLKATIDKATGAVQDAFGSLTGNTSQEAKGELKKDRADAEDSASHSTLRGPGFTATASGVHKDDPDRTAGSWNQTVGSAKETVGGLVGSEDLKQSGREQNVQGQGQEAKGQVSDFASGVSDRVTGVVGGAATALTGDKTKQKEFEAQHDTGKTAQRGVEHDLSKKADAQAAAHK